MSGTGSAGIKAGDPDARAFNRDWFKQLLPKNLSFRTRDMSWYAKESVLQLYRLKIEASLPQHLAYSVTATHHQKMVLVDYEYTDTATGFVMGHNLLRNYWDRDAHEYDDPLRLGFGPWQDLSMQVWGEVLWCLNDNFTSAWKLSQPLLGRDQPIPDSRSVIITPQFFAGSAAKRGSTCMAQICRTQPQESDWSILELYRTVLPNARKYIYIENQYFRQPELAKLLRQTYRKLKAGGWKQELYVFIVTNVPEKAGRITTYETLNALGKGNQMPVIHKKRAGDQDNSEDAQLIRKRDLEGMNIHVCTLCTSGTQAQKLLRPPQTVYRDIYVHSKLLLIDDVFFTLGSANFNTRSMVIDSELNIAAPSPQITKELREKLWGLHTKRQPSDDPATEFETWRRLMSKNLKNRNDGVPLEGSLIEFYDDSSSIWKVD